MKLLVANRGEIAIRVARAAAELDIPTTAVYSEDDAFSLHVCKTDESAPLKGIGARAYLDMEQIIGVAKDRGCDTIHPGYGFLSENAAFARRCVEEGISFVGPTPENLELFGDKVRARALAEENGVPVVAGISGPVDLDQARAFFDTLPPNTSMLFKAVGGGGGRGMRVVSMRDEMEEAFERARSEAEAAFGTGEIYVEQMVLNARHIEVQIAGDHSGGVTHFGDRDCSIQRRHQKLIEIAPAPLLSDELRTALAAAAVKLAKAA
ncbi:MAG: carbamoyl-phosphate synthase large subunit, partial [Deltaproteobacteria bacterium]|nr:carbamoyl-phosphate synthase large subunit [Deltaproteobacteria bacterium]